MMELLSEGLEMPKGCQESPFGAKLKCDVFLIMYLISAARYTNAFILSYTLKRRFALKSRSMHLLSRVW